MLGVSGPALHELRGARFEAVGPPVGTPRRTGSRTPPQKRSFTIAPCLVEILAVPTSPHTPSTGPRSSPCFATSLAWRSVAALIPMGERRLPSLADLAVTLRSRPVFSTLQYGSIKKGFGLQ